MEFTDRELEVIRFALTVTIGDFVIRRLGWPDTIEEIKNIVIKIKDEKT
jgi:hypothetical protein